MAPIRLTLTALEGDRHHVGLQLIEQRRPSALARVARKLTAFWCVRELVRPRDTNLATMPIHRSQ